MNRKKRDVTDRAYTKGYQVGISGRSKYICPHETPQTRQCWISGWRDGRTDNWDGLNHRHGLHQKLHNIKH